MYNLHKSYDSKHTLNSFKGTLLIPDISGFTKFVNETEFHTGREITRELLSVIVESNQLNLNISEIEGDAVLFYSRRPIKALEIKEQFENMLANFKLKVEELEMETGLEINLSLKMIVHYGEMATYKIGQFEKLYGKTLIEAHRLLKNSIESDSYILLTESVFEAMGTENLGPCYYAGSQLCEIQGDLKKIGYTYFDYQEQPAEIVLQDRMIAQDSKLLVSAMGF